MFFIVSNLYEQVRPTPPAQEPTALRCRGTTTSTPWCQVNVGARGENASFGLPLAQALDMQVEQQIGSLSFEILLKEQEYHH